VKKTHQNKSQSLVLIASEPERLQHATLVLAPAAS
jgi:hypothetical protein